MKIKNLKDGQVFKNYRELCEVLGIKATTGTSKIAQLKELERYCEYHKDGNKMIIDRIYAEEREKMDKRTLGNNNNQARCIRYLLLNFLGDFKIREDEVIGFSKGILLKKLYMANENYTIAKYSRSKYAEALEVEELAIHECFDYIENNSISAIRKAIATLRSQSVLGYKYSFSWIDKKGIHHHCDTLEENTIHLMEEEVMKQMNVRNKNKIWEFGRWPEFKRRVTDKLQDDYKTLLPNIDKYYYSFHFNYNNQSIQNQMRYMEERQDMSFEVAKAGIQDLWSDSLDKTIENRHVKAKEKTASIDTNLVENYRKQDKFKPEQTKVKNSVTKLDYETININEQIKMNLDEEEVPF